MARHAASLVAKPTASRKEKRLLLKTQIARGSLWRTERGCGGDIGANYFEIGAVDPCRSRSVDQYPERYSSCVLRNIENNLVAAPASRSFDRTVLHVVKGDTRVAFVDPRPQSGPILKAVSFDERAEFDALTEISCYPASLAEFCSY